MNYDLRDAFQELSILSEAEEFNLSDEEQIKKMDDFIKGDEFDEVQMVIDVDADGMDELEPSYEGKIICQCPICKSLVYKAEEDIIEDPTSDYVNVDEYCPYCKEEGGMIIVGKVAPYPAHEEEKVEDEIETKDGEANDELKIEDEEEVEEKEEVEESLNKPLNESACSCLADTDAQEESIKFIEKMAKKLGINLRPGTKVGKYPQSVVLDKKYQGGEVYISSNGAFEINHQWFGDWHDDYFDLEDIDRDEVLAALGTLIESLDEGADEEMVMHQLKEKVADFIYDEIADVDDNMALSVHAAIPEYNIDWCNEDGNNFIAEVVDGKKHELARKIVDALFVNAPRELGEECSKLEEADKPAAQSIEDAQKWVDYDMEHYGKISGKTSDLVKKAGFQIIKDDHGDYEVAAGKYEELEEGIIGAVLGGIIGNNIGGNIGKSLLGTSVGAALGSALGDSVYNMLFGKVLDDENSISAIIRKAVLAAAAAGGISYIKDNTNVFSALGTLFGQEKNIASKAGVGDLKDLLTDEGQSALADINKSAESIQKDDEEGAKNLIDKVKDFVQNVKLPGVAAGEKIADWLKGKYWKALGATEALEESEDVCPECGKNPCECSEECQKEECEDCDEACKEECEKVDECDMFEDLDTEGLDKLISEKLGKEFITESAYVDGNKITVEDRDGQSFVFEAKQDEDGFRLINEGFTVKGRLEEKNIICEDLLDALDAIEQVKQEVEDEIAKNEAGEEAASEINPNEELEEVAVNEGISYYLHNEEDDVVNTFSSKKKALDAAKKFGARCSVKLWDDDESELIASFDERGKKIKDELDESKPPYGNPNFDEEKYGKYFDDNNKLIPELADEYFEIVSKQMKEIDAESEKKRAEEEGEVEEACNESILTEKKWDISLKSGAALRQAIDGEDGAEIKEALKNCYKEINRRLPDALDDDSLEEILVDLDMADFEPDAELDVDEEEARENIDTYLSDFYDFCDGYNIWVEM